MGSLFGVWALEQEAEASRYLTWTSGMVLERSRSTLRLKPEHEMRWWTGGVWGDVLLQPERGPWPLLRDGTRCGNVVLWMLVVGHVACCL